MLDQYIMISRWAECEADYAVNGLSAEADDVVTTATEQYWGRSDLMASGAGSLVQGGNQYHARKVDCECDDGVLLESTGCSTAV